MFGSYFGGVVQLVKKATSDDATATPGFLLNDLNKYSLQSTEKSDELYDQLLQRLTKFDSANVKLKALRCIKSVSRGGHPSFRAHVMDDKEEIRKCLHYKAADDPIRGDEPTILVHNEAQELLNVIFESTAPTSGISDAARFHGIEGGVTETTNAGIWDSMKTASTTVVSAVGSGFSAAANVSVMGYKVSDLIGTKKAPPTSSFGEPDLILHENHTPVTGAPNPYDEIAPSDEFATRNVTEVEEKDDVSDNSFASSNTPQEIPQFGSGAGGRLVTVLLSTANRTSCPTNILMQFVRGVRSTNATAQTTDALILALDSAAWKIKLRALVGIETLLETIDLKDECANFIKQKPNPIRVCFSSPQLTVRTKAQKIISILGIDSKVSVPQKAQESILLNPVETKKTSDELSLFPSFEVESLKPSTEEVNISSAFDLIIAEQKQNSAPISEPLSSPQQSTSTLSEFKDLNIISAPKSTPIVFESTTSKGTEASAFSQTNTLMNTQTNSSVNSIPTNTSTKKHQTSDEILAELLANSNPSTPNRMMNSNMMNQGMNPNMMNPGMNYMMNQGMNPMMNQGMNPMMNQGMNPNMMMNPGMRQMMNQNMMNQGMNPMMNQGMSNFNMMNYDSGFNSSSNQSSGFNFINSTTPLSTEQQKPQSVEQKPKQPDPFAGLLNV